MVVNGVKRCLDGAARVESTGMTNYFRSFVFVQRHSKHTTRREQSREARPERACKRASEHEASEEASERGSREVMKE
jgi:hypothetical protein